MRMYSSRRHDPTRPGAAAVEFAMVSPLLLALLVGAIEVGSLVETQHMLSTASSAAAREVVAGVTDDARLKQAVAGRLAAFGLTDVEVRVAVTEESGMAVSQTTLPRARSKRVRVTLVVRTFTNGLRPLLLLQEVVVAATETVVWTGQPRD